MSQIPNIQLNLPKTLAIEPSTSQLNLVNQLNDIFIGGMKVVAEGVRLQDQKNQAEAKLAALNENAKQAELHSDAVKYERLGQEAKNTYEQLKDQEKLGVYALVNNANSDELGQLVKMNPGIVDPENLAKLNELAGQRMALFDSNEILDYVSKNPEIPASDVLKNFVANRKIYNPLTAAAYQASLTDNVMAAQRNAIAKNMQIRIGEAIDTLQLSYDRDAFTTFKESGDLEEFTKRTDQFRKDVKIVNPGITDGQINQFIAKSISNNLTNMANPYMAKSKLAELTSYFGKDNKNIIVDLQDTAAIIDRSIGQYDQAAYNKTVGSIKDVITSLKRDDVTDGDINDAKLFLNTIKQARDDGSVGAKLISDAEFQGFQNDINNEIIKVNRQRTISQFDQMIDISPNMSVLNVVESDLNKALTSTKLGSALSPTENQIAILQGKIIKKREDLYNSAVVDRYDRGEAVLLTSKQDNEIIKRVEADKPMTQGELYAKTYQRYGRFPQQMVESFSNQAQSAKVEDVSQAILTYDAVEKSNPQAAIDLLQKSKSLKLQTIANLSTQLNVKPSEIARQFLDPKIDQYIPEGAIYVGEKLDVNDNAKFNPKFTKDEETEQIDVRREIKNATDPNSWPVVGAFYWKADVIPDNAVSLYKDAFTINYALARSRGFDDAAALVQAKSQSSSLVASQYQVHNINGTRYLFRPQDLNIQSSAAMELLDEKFFDYKDNLSLKKGVDNINRLFLDFSRVTSKDGVASIPVTYNGTINGVAVNNLVLDDLKFPLNDDGRVKLRNELAPRRRENEERLSDLRRQIEEESLR